MWFCSTVAGRVYELERAVKQEIASEGRVFGWLAVPSTWGGEDVMVINNPRYSPYEDFGYGPLICDMHRIKRVWDSLSCRWKSYLNDDGEDKLWYCVDPGFYGECSHEEDENDTSWLDE